jgi:rhodanese-related sulfurtransferase
VRILALVLAALLLTGCAAATATATDAGDAAASPTVASGYRQVSAAELQQMLANEDVTLVNVHIPFEGNIPGTDIAIPYNDIVSQAPSRLPDKGAPIVVYCMAGPMSHIAAEALAGMGYTHVSDLSGGMNAWREAGNALEGG